MKAKLSQFQRVNTKFRKVFRIAHKTPKSRFDVTVRLRSGTFFHSRVCNLVYNSWEMYVRSGKRENPEVSITVLGYLNSSNLCNFGHHGLSQNIVNNLVGNTFSCGHELVQLASSSRSRHDLMSEKFASGEVPITEFQVNHFALGALARTRSTWKLYFVMLRLQKSIPIYQAKRECVVFN